MSELIKLFPVENLEIVSQSLSFAKSSSFLHLQKNLIEESIFVEFGFIVQNFDLVMVDNQALFFLKSDLVLHLKKIHLNKNLVVQLRHFIAELNLTDYFE